MAMRRISSQEIGIECSACGTFNDVDAAVCIKCGHVIHTDVTARHGTREQSREAKIRQAHEAAVTETPFALNKHAKRSQQSRRTITILGVSLVILLLIVLIWNRIQVWQWEQQITGAYQEAVECYESADYLCSRAKLSALLTQAPNYPGAEDLLRIVRWELAQDYMSENLWEQAAAELMVLTSHDDERPEFRAALMQTYDALIRDAAGRGDIGEVIRLNLERLSILGVQR